MAQPVASRRSVGPIAVQLGLITAEQLQAAQAFQARAPGKSLDQVLVDRKLLTPDQVRSIQQEMNRGSAPAAPPHASPVSRPTGHATGRRVVQSSASPKKTWVIVAAMALVPVLGIVAYVALKPKPVEPVVEAKKPPPPPPPEDKDKDKEKEKGPKNTGSNKGSEAKVEIPRIRVTIRKLPGHSDLVTRFNDAADKINSMRDPEQYKPVLADLGTLVEEARGKEQAEDIRNAYTDVIKAINLRADQVFTWLSDEVASLKAAGRYGDALKAWEWFPGNLDPVGSFGRKIDAQKKSIRGEADDYFGKSMKEIESLVTSGKLEEAHLQLLRALEIGIDDLYAKAEKRMVELTKLVDDAVKRRTEEELAAFERTKDAEKEAAKAAALYQDQFWKFVSERKLDGAQAFLSKQKAGATAEVQQAIGGMERALAELRTALGLVAKILEPQAGRTVSLAFLENGRQQNRSFLLKAVRDGQIVYAVEGRELTVPVAELHSSEISRLAASGPEANRDLLNGVARLLDGGFDEAHIHLGNAGERATGLVAFVEKSSVFLERNIPVMKERAARFVNEKQWERAIQEYTKLASLPKERQEALRARARAYYHINNFMAAVSDVDSLFDMDDYADANLELLNQSFKRSALIDKAIRMYEKASAKKPESVQVLASLVALYMQIHDFPKAKETLARAQKLKGGGRELAGLAHLVDVALEPAFPGKTYRAQFGRYDLETNVSQEYATKMARFMDKVYQSYIKVFPYKKNETLRFHLKLFATEGEFFSYYKRSTGADPSGPHGKILAYYMSLTKELVGWNADGIEETLQHEGLHQYFDYFIEDCPIWFNEGYASYFETSTADEVRFNDGRHKTAEWLRNSNELPSMKEIFMMSGDVFRAKGAWHYGSSWSVVYWFVKSGRKKILDRYFEALMEGKTQEQAFDAIFGPGKEDINDFDARWKKAVRTGDYEDQDK